jgi:hypothetical protein
MEDVGKLSVYSVVVGYVAKIMLAGKFMGDTRDDCELFGSRQMCKSS